MSEINRMHAELTISGVHFAKKPDCMSYMRAVIPYEGGRDVAVVEKIVILSHADFLEFQNDLFADRVFIKEHYADMYRSADGKWHCLLVIGAGETDGILVEAEGYDYPFYAAALKDADLIVKDRVPIVAGRLSDPTPKRQKKGIER